MLDIRLGTMLHIVLQRRLHRVIHRVFNKTAKKLHRGFYSLESNRCLVLFKSTFFMSICIVSVASIRL